MRTSSRDKELKKKLKKQILGKKKDLMAYDTDLAENTPAYRSE